MNNNDLMGGLDMPNVMHPGTWVVVGIILAAILGGFIFLFTRWLKTVVWWKRLDYLSLKYFGKNHQPDTALLIACMKKVQELFEKHCRPVQPKWTSEAVTKALRDARIYVMDTDKWPEFNALGTPTGRNLAGQQAGRNLIVGKNLAAFLHECAHRVEEVVDRELDMDHTTWVKDGIRAAEDEFSVWLASQKPA